MKIKIVDSNYSEDSFEVFVVDDNPGGMIFDLPST
jgi:hypothetical protein